MLQNNRVLVVDDRQVITTMIQCFLEAEGFIVDCVSSGMNALNHLRDVCYDVVLIDLVMEELDGFALAEKVRQFAPDLKIILMSGHPREDFEKKLEQCPHHAFLHKPFQLSSLMDAIST